jgi:hypothetical protein
METLNIGLNMFYLICDFNPLTGNQFCACRSFALSEIINRTLFYKFRALTMITEFTRHSQIGCFTQDQAAQAISNSAH